MTTAENYVFLHAYAHNKGELAALGNVLRMAANSTSVDDLCSMVQTNINALEDSQAGLKEAVASVRPDDGAGR